METAKRNWRILLSALLVTIATALSLMIARRSGDPAVTEPSAACSMPSESSPVGRRAEARIEADPGNNVSEPIPLRLIEEKRIEGTDTVPLGFVRDVAVAPDGTVILFDLTANELRSYDNEGRILWAVSGEEQAFNRVYMVGLAADTIIVLDRVAGEDRIQLFDLRGVPIGLSRGGHSAASFSSIASTACRPVALGGSAHATFLLFAQRSTQVAEDVYYVYELRQLHLVDGGLTPVIWRAQDDSPRRMVEVAFNRPDDVDRSSGSRMGAVRFSLQPPFAVAPSFAFSQDLFFVSQGDGFEIDRWDYRGNRLGTTRLPIRRRPIQPELLKDHISALYSDFDSILRPTAEREIGAALASWPTRQVMPVIGGMWASASGELAVRRPDLEVGDSVAIDFLDGVGTFRGRAWVPTDLSIIQFTGAKLYGILVAGARPFASTDDSTHSQLGGGEAVSSRSIVVRYGIADERVR